MDVYLRYGTADTPAIKKQRERKDIQVAYYWHYYNIHYPLIRCLEAEAENKKLHKFVPTTYCPNYQEDIVADAPDSPQSRYHLVVGEDDAASVISETVVARDEWRKNTKQTLELHTVRLIDNDSKQVLATAPVVFSSVNPVDIEDKDLPACRDFTDVMQDVLEQTLVAPQDRENAAKR